MSSFSNQLIHETSPYLLQHAHNPVDWLPYTSEVLQNAKNSEKLIVISIGYAACHWCHVMEENCFENEDIATVMNDFYTNIKVDREEKPAVDHSYMQALQLMTRQGGWPLNIIALPDGRPVWGATYVPPEQWKNVLLQLKNLYQKDPEKMIGYANKLEEGLQQMQLIEVEDFKENNFSKAFLTEKLLSLRDNFDHKNGGNQGAPKFMLPTNFDFLIEYASQQKNKDLQDFVFFTLQKMAYGGVYDQLQGGFSRYSVDERWHIPHFEKMLYDNAQLVSLYAKAYLQSKKELFKTTAATTINFMETEWQHKEGGFYASLDADSLDKNNKLTEGAYYVWKKQELQNALGKDFEIFKDYYNINEYGYWEDKKYVLRRTKTPKEIAKKHAIAEDDLQTAIKISKERLLQRRSKRNKPRLDNKILTSWNALTAKAYCDAYRAFGNKDYLEQAQKILSFLWDKQQTEKANLLRSYQTKVEACLDDYAFFIEALIELYQETFEISYLEKAKKLTEISLEKFLDKEQNLFYYASKTTANIFLKTKEIQDNVIPSSNAVMAENLFCLGKYFGKENYIDLSKKMLASVQKQITHFPGAYTNWLKLANKHALGFFEIVIVGPDALKIKEEFNSHFLPNCLFAGTTNWDNENSALALLRNRGKENNTLIYICTNNSCQTPVNNTENALKEIQNN